MNGPLVSVIVPVFNRAAMLRDAVQSVVAQQHRPIQLIIIDDGSTDNTHKVALEIVAEFSCEMDSEPIRSTLDKQEPLLFGEVLIIKNSGPGLARQAGLEQAQGDYIQYLDSDDLLHPLKLSSQVQALEQNPELGVAYCKQQLCDMNDTLISAAWMRSGEVHKQMFPAMLAGRLWGTPVPLYRTQLLAKAGPWTSLHSEEDWEYDCRVAAQGVQMHYDARTLVTIRQHSEAHFGQLGVTGKRRKLTDRAKAYQLIYQHANLAAIKPSAPEFVRFRRMSFHLVRQLCESALETEAKQLFKVVLANSATSRKEKLNYITYSSLAAVLGWTRIGRWSAKLDEWRA